MGLTKRPDSYYVEFRVIDSEDANAWCWRVEYQEQGRNAGKSAV